MRLSVVITTYNHPEWLEKVLWGFEAQTFRGVRGARRRRRLRRPHPRAPRAHPGPRCATRSSTSGTPRRGSGSARSSTQAMRARRGSTCSSPTGTASRAPTCSPCTRASRPPATSSRAATSSSHGNCQGDHARRHHGRPRDRLHLAARPRHARRQAVAAPLLGPRRSRACSTRSPPRGQLSTGTTRASGVTTSCG